MKNRRSTPSSASIPEVISSRVESERENILGFLMEFIDHKSINPDRALPEEPGEEKSYTIKLYRPAGITGVVRLEGRIIFLLDLEKIVAELNPELGLRFDENVTWEQGVQYRALIADDSTLIREMIGDLLHRAGFLVEKTNHGGECWERLQQIKKIAEAENRPVTDYVQIVISDIEMPNVDGHNLTKRIKEDPGLKDLPVVLFSSIITDKLRHKGEAVGADDQISKPEITHVAQRAVALIKSRIAEAAHA